MLAKKFHVTAAQMAQRMLKLRKSLKNYLEGEGYSAPAKLPKPYLKWALAVAACLVIFCGGMISGLLLAENRQQGGNFIS